LEMTEPKVCKLEFDIVVVCAPATEDKYIAWVDVLVPPVACQRYSLPRVSTCE